MVALVAVRQIAVAFLVDVAVAGYKQIGPGAEDRPYAGKRERETT